MKKLEEIIQAKPSEIANYLNSIATFYGNSSWLIIPENNNKLCLVAHIDTVFPDDGEVEILKEEFTWTSPQGIGGDDRCGVYALLKIYNELPIKNRPMLLFTDGEERGGIGAYESIKLFREQLKDVIYFIELDRQGSKDMVFYNREPDSFINYFGKYGFIESIGSFSDISILGRELNKCSVNVSVGYYHQHSLMEYININELNQTIEKVKHICISETGNNIIWKLK